MRFHHVGVPTDRKRPGETYIAGGKVFITDSQAHPYRFEYLRFEPGSPLPDVMKKQPHVAYMVDDLAAGLKGEKVLLEPFDPMPNLRVAFILKDNVVVEVMQAL